MTHLLDIEGWGRATELRNARAAARMRFSSGALLMGSDVGSRFTSVRRRISFASLPKQRTYLDQASSVMGTCAADCITSFRFSNS